MSNELKIIYFNINGNTEPDDSENAKSNYSSEPEQENCIESPKIILDNFLKNHISLDLETSKDNFMNYNYSFVYEVEKNCTKNCIFIIINKLDHQYKDYCFDSKAYIIVCNLEKEDTIKKLNKLMECIKNNWDKEIKIHIIGIYETEIIPNLTQDKMIGMLNETKLLFNYYEIKCGKENTNKEISEDEKYEKINELLEKIFSSIIQEKKRPKLIKNNAQKANKSIQNVGKSRCMIC